MSKQRRAKASNDDAHERLTAEFLHDHPDFFERHLDLLEELQIPHPVGDGVVSLIERQVQRLREQNRQIKRKLLDLVQNARDNDRINERMHGLALALMDAASVDEVLITVDDIFRNDFHADAVATALFADALPQLERANVRRIAKEEGGFAPFRNLFRDRKPDCSPLDPEALGYLFGAQAAKIASVVVVPLVEQRDFGLLAVGSEDAERFRPGMGTLYLERMGELVSHVLQARLR